MTVTLHRRHVQTVRNRIVYLFVLVCISGIMVTFYEHPSMLCTSDIINVEKETFAIQRSGRDAMEDSVNNVRNSVDERKLIQTEADEADALQSHTNTLHMHVDRNVQDELTSLSSHKEDSNCSNSELDFTYNLVRPISEISHYLTNNNRTVSDASCAKLFENNVHTLIETSLHMSLDNRNIINNADYLHMTQNCSKFKRLRGYLESPFTIVEQTFPIAYSILAYKQVEQIERLLRAIYRPQNHYCIHMDAGAIDEDIKTIQSISSCFSNVYISSRAISVQWGTFSVLEAVLICMSDVWSKDWRYFINLTGQEFPMKTNLELVKILTALKGANLVDGTWLRYVL